MRWDASLPTLPKPAEKLSSRRAVNAQELVHFFCAPKYSSLPHDTVLKANTASRLMGVWARWD